MSMFVVLTPATPPPQKKPNQNKKRATATFSQQFAIKGIGMCSLGSLGNSFQMIIFNYQHLLYFS